MAGNEQIVKWKWTEALYVDERATSRATQVVKVFPFTGRVFRFLALFDVEFGVERAPAY